MKKLKTRTMGALTCLLLACVSVTAAAQDASACREDTKKYCASTQGDESAALNCLLDHQNDVTDACYNELKQKMTAAPAPAAAVPTNSHANDICNDCGRVESVDTISDPTAQLLGAIGGGILGAFVGNHIGQGSGNVVATAAGGAGGALAGNQIAANMNKTWKVRVHFQNGEVHSFTFKEPPNLRAGDEVIRSGVGIVLR